MDLTQLEYFRAVARLENVTKAAQELYISQPTLSQSIARLEENLGVALFDRKNGKVRLNDAGRMFLSRVNNAFAELNTGYAELDRFKEQRQDWVSVTSSVIDIFRVILMECREKLPDLRIDHTLSFDNGIMELLMNGRVEFAVTPNPIDDPKVHCTPLYEEEVFAMVGVGHPLAELSEVSVDELKKWPLVCNNCDSDVHFMEELFQCDRQELDIITITGECAILRTLTETGAGVGFIPARVAVRHLSDPDSMEHPIRISPPFRRTNCISTRVGHSLSSTAEKFYALVLDFCARDSRHVDQFIRDYYGH